MSDKQESTAPQLTELDSPGCHRQVFNDEADMRPMGKKQQFQLRVSIAAFSVVAIAGYCYVTSTSTEALANGGTGGIIVIFLANWFGLAFVVLSLAEMSSIAPTAGGQYHWASGFAPPSMQRIISYFAGWLSPIAWLAGASSALFLSGSTFQGLIVVTQHDYVPQAYQGYLFVVMTATFCLAINIFFSRQLALLENFVFVLFVVVFVATIATLWSIVPFLSAKEVFGTFTQGEDWGILGLSLLVSQNAIMFLIVGSDATVHMAEETRHAAVVVLKAMITSYFINASLAFIMTVTFCFVLKNYAAAENSPIGQYGYPFIQVFINATDSIAGGVTLVAALTSLHVLGIVNWMASCARQIFAFARDQGLPFHRWISKVNAAGTVPRNSVIVAWAFVVLINLISLGSVTAFEAIVSLQILALMSTYFVSLSCIVWRRLSSAPLPASPWTLGRAALPINLIEIVYCVFLIIFLPWPATPDVTAQNMNWAIVMFSGIMLISFVYYLAFARKSYRGPVAYTTARELAG